MSFKPTLKDILYFGAFGIAAVVSEGLRHTAEALGLREGLRYNFRGKEFGVPERFQGIHYKPWFEDVAKTVSTRAGQRGQVQGHLAETHLRAYNKGRLEVYREILEWFAGEGFLERRWKLLIPSPISPNSDYRSTPYHDKDGNRLGRLDKEGVQWNPYLLTEEQKAELIGVQYPLSAKGEDAEKYGKLTYEIREGDFTFEYMIAE